MADVSNLANLDSFGRGTGGGGGGGGERRDEAACGMSGFIAADRFWYDCKFALFLPCMCAVQTIVKGRGIEDLEKD